MFWIICAALAGVVAFAIAAPLMRRERGEAELFALALAMRGHDAILAPLIEIVLIDGKQLAEFPVVALADVPQASFIGRAWDSLRLMFK